MDGARTLILNGLAQNDLDMANHKLLNLDTSNLPPSGIPPTIHPAANNWLHDWDSTTLEWTATRPTFTDISGLLTTQQQLGIRHLGIVLQGTWEANIIGNTYLPTLDGIRSPAANVSMGGNRLTNLGNPVNPTDAVNMAFMDMLLTGLNPKEAVRCATTERIVLSTLVRPVDGVTLVAGDRVLVKNQGTGIAAAENGIYIAATGAWSRSTDADTGAELDRAYCTVLEGTINIGSSWVQVNTITNLGTDPVDFLLFASGTQIIAGNGLSKVGNTISAVGTSGRIEIGTAIDIASHYVGQNSITTLGTISTGTWAATLISPTYGGTGVNNGAHTLTLAGNMATALGGGAAPDSALTFTLQGTTGVTLPMTGTLSTLTGNETLTNKRITRRVKSILSNSKPGINANTDDVFSITQLAENIASMSDNFIGTPTDSQDLLMWIKDNGISRDINWGNKFTASTDLPLPLVTSPGKWLFLSFIWNIALAQFVLTQKLNNI